MICLPGASHTRAVELAENMREFVEDKEIQSKMQTLKITASFGVCTMKPSHGNSFEDIIECADRKLYAAKNNGRNRFES